MVLLVSGKDIKRCAEAIEPAKKGRIHVFVGTSPCIARSSSVFQSEVFERRQHDRIRCRSAPTSSSPPWTPAALSRIPAEVVAGVIGAVPPLLTLPDTVIRHGRVEGFVEWLYGQVPELRNVVVSVHRQQRPRFGGGQFTRCSERGRTADRRHQRYRERAGNAAIEEVAMAVHLHFEVWGVHRP